MKFRNLVATLGLACIAAACSRSTEPQEAAKKQEEPASRLLKTNNEVLIKLSAPERKLASVLLAPLQETKQAHHTRAFARVLDPSPLTDLLAELQKGALDATTAKAELERLRVLRSQDNTSEKSLQAAELSFRQADLSVVAARVKIRSTWGSRIAEAALAGQGQGMDPRLRAVTDGTASLVRVDVDPIMDPSKLTGKAQLVIPEDPHQAIAATFVDQAPTVDPLTQTKGLLFLAESKGRLRPGMALQALLDDNGPETDGFIVPETAIVRHLGSAWVYVQSGEDLFKRVRVDLDAPMTGGWFVPTALTKDAVIVIQGAQLLLSEELKESASPE